MVTLTHVKFLRKELGLSSFIKIKQGGSREEDENVKKITTKKFAAKMKTFDFLKIISSIKCIPFKATILFPLSCFINFLCPNTFINGAHCLYA